MTANNEDVEISSYIGQKGYTIYKEALTIEEQVYIRKELTAKPFIPKSPVQPPGFPIYRESKHKFYIPRYFGYENYGEPDDCKIPEGDDINITFNGKLRDYQEEVVDIYLEKTKNNKYGGGGLLELKTGAGKCLAKNTPVLMYDGTIKMVQDIFEGELLMGDDSTPRCVLTLARGREMMYKIISDKGDYYVVNESHILSLVNNNNIIDISVKDYLNLNENEKNILKGYKTGIYFKDINVGIDPYDYGEWLCMSKSKCIPYEYKCNSRYKQLILLAGIIDSIGRVFEDRYEIHYYDNGFLDDIIFIARCIGISAYKYEHINNNNDKNFHKKVIVYGNSIRYIPTKEVILKNVNNLDKNNLVYNISVERLQEDDYYGFEIDGNRRFVLGDFTVTHNTVIGLNIISRVGKKALIIVHKGFLLNQWIERIEQYLPAARVGKIQGQIIDIENKDIVIGMLQSLSMKEYPSEIFNSFGMTVVDEVHHISSEVFSRSLTKIVTRYTLGLSATMNRKDGLTKVFKMYLGDILYKSKSNNDDRVLVKAIEYKTVDDEFNEVETDYRGNPKFSTMITKLCSFNHRSEYILNIIKNELQLNPNQQMIVLAHNKNLLTYLHDAIQHRNIATVGYYVGGMKEEQLKISEKKQVIIATFAMASEGLDIPSLTTLLFATPKTDITQSVGRILRMKHAQPVVIDIIDQHDIFKMQWSKRKAFYMKNKYKIVQTDDYNKNNWFVKYDPEVLVETKKTSKKGQCLIKVDNLNISDE